MELNESTGMFAAMGGAGIFTLIIWLFSIIVGWKIFTKAHKPGWAILIPIYNVIVYIEIIGKPWWWLFLVLFPPLSFVFAIWATNLLSKSFDKGVGFTIGLIFLPIIFYPILAFGDAKYVGSHVTY